MSESITPASHGGAPIEVHTPPVRGSSHQPPPIPHLSLAYRASLAQVLACWSRIFVSQLECSSALQMPSLLTSDSLPLLLQDRLRQWLPR